MATRNEIVWKVSEAMNYHYKCNFNVAFLPNYEPDSTLKSLNADYSIIYVVVQRLVWVLEGLVYLNPFEQYSWHNGINNNLYKPRIPIMDPKVKRRL